MIDCTEYRRRITAEPHLARETSGEFAASELAQHAATCAECAAFAQRLLAFEDRLSRALKFDVPAAPAARDSNNGSNVVPLFGKRTKRTSGKPWFAMAASLLAGIGVAALLWVATSQTSLASDVVKHMAHEPTAWTATDKRVPGTDLAAVLNDAHVRLLPNMSRVSYAQSCGFRGHNVPHLVVQTDEGPVTVMVLAHESVSKPQHFNEQGYRGMIVPMPGHGSVAVITRSTSVPDTERVVSNLAGAIQWTR